MGFAVVFTVLIVMDYSFSVARGFSLLRCPSDISADPMNAPFLRIACAGFTLFACFALASFALSTSNKLDGFLLIFLFLSLLGVIVIHFDNVTADRSSRGV